MKRAYLGALVVWLGMTLSLTSAVLGAPPGAGGPQPPAGPPSQPPGGPPFQPPGKPPSQPPGKPPSQPPGKPPGGTADDPFQRYIRFHNALAQTIYPVIQAPQDAGGKGTNCKTGGLLRIIVNDQVEGAGIPPGGTVTVKLPKDRPCPTGGFYDAARIYILIANFDAFEKLTNPSQQTVRDPAWDYARYSPCDGCWVGTAQADYGHDAPGQLLEYTMISQNPATGDAFPDPNNPQGTPLIDFDVSYVDDAYLPVAMALDDGGATQFMGSTLPHDVFNARLTQFLTDGHWSRYAAYAPINWAEAGQCSAGTPTDPNKTSFSCLVPRTDRVPSANILVTDAQTGGVSAFYLPSWDAVTPRECNTAGTADPTANLKCSTPRPDGDGLTTGFCCPNENGVMLGCCDQEKFLIDNTHRRFDVTVTPKVFRLSNDTLTNVVSRWTRWHGPAHDPCAGASPEAITTAPAIDKAGFCAAFKKTVDFVWNEFAPQCPGDGESADRCISAAVIGYDVKGSTFDPALCTKCPGNSEADCPRSCALEAQRNESVQALQRGLPWTPAGDPAACAQCPSADATACPTACILPTVPSPAARLYHRDKFLHFWPDYPSVYNLNPFARFVHAPVEWDRRLGANPGGGDNGLAAPGAYSFSIDDFYGNFGGPGSTLLIHVGTTAGLPNREPFDPFKQYRAGLGTGWHHATVCGRRYTLPPGTPVNVGLSAPISFWNNGAQQTECVVRLHPTADETQYLEFLLREVTYQVTNGYTGHAHTVQGLSGVYAVRQPGDVPPDNPHCMAQSTARDLVAAGFCRANLSSGTLNLDYVGVSDAACLDANDATCGKPLVNFNAPSLTRSIGRAGSRRPEP